VFHDPFEFHNISMFRLLDNSPCSRHVRYLSGHSTTSRSRAENSGWSLNDPIITDDALAFPTESYSCDLISSAEILSCPIMISLQEVQRRFLRSGGRLGLIQNVDFVGVLGWLDVDDGLGGSPTSSRDHDVVLRVDARWLNEDHLLASLSARNIQSVLLDVPHVFSCHFAVDRNFAIVSSLGSATTAKSLPKPKGLSLDLRGDHSNSSVSRGHANDEDLKGEYIEQT
jgi:hypothetical protein